MKSFPVHQIIIEIFEQMYSVVQKVDKRIWINTIVIECVQWITATALFIVKSDVSFVSIGSHRHNYETTS